MTAPPGRPITHTALNSAEQTTGTDHHPQRVAENTFPPGRAIASDAESTFSSRPADSPNSESTFSSRDAASHDAKVSSERDTRDGPSAGNKSDAPAALQETFERKYDDLGLEDFADQVIRFGYWLEAHGRALSPADRERALAEYAFLQNRLSLLLEYEYKSLQEQGYLLSAEYRLYAGAVNGGFVAPGRVPQALVDVAGTVALLEGASPTRPAPRPRVKELPLELKPAHDPRFVPIVDREIAGIIWGKGIREQGIGRGERGWEKYIASQDPNAKLLPPGSKGFDVFNETNGEATSAKTLDTKTNARIAKPETIYKKVQEYVDAAVNYQQRTALELDPAEIQTKTIQLVIPEHTSSEQWRYLLRAVIYGKDNGVKVVITRIRG